MVNPQMMVDRAQAKRDAIDTNMAALDGLKVGLLYVGPIIAILTYFGGSNDIMEAITNYGTFWNMGMGVSDRKGEVGEGSCVESVLYFCKLGFTALKLYCFTNRCRLDT